MFQSDVAYLVARSRCTKLRVSRYLMPDAICAAIYSRQLKLQKERQFLFLGFGGGTLIYILAFGDKPSGILKYANIFRDTLYRQ
jgi:hypothetical protein